jgi:hypothetical protein
MKATWQSPVSTDVNLALIQRTVQSVAVAKLMDLAANTNASSGVRTVANEALRSLDASLKRTVATGDTAAHYRSTVDDIERFLARPFEPRKPSTQLATPPGDPIGN